MAQDSYARLAGQRFVLDGREGPFRLCPVCGSCEGRVGPGKGPHLAALRCTGCDTHISWLGRAHLDALVAKRHRGAA